MFCFQQELVKLSSFHVDKYEVFTFIFCPYRNFVSMLYMKWMNSQFVLCWKPYSYVLPKAAKSFSLLALFEVCLIRSIILLGIIVCTLFQILNMYYNVIIVDDTKFFIGSLVYWMERVFSLFLSLRTHFRIFVLWELALILDLFSQDMA